MNITNMFQDLGVSASGLLAERTRMGLIATNIAHAADTNTGAGDPYRRKIATFETVMEGEMAGGVRVHEILDDDVTPHPVVTNWGHPDANAEGQVRLPNVDPSFEMVDLLTAARAYEANLQAMQTSAQMVERTLQVLR